MNDADRSILDYWMDISDILFDWSVKNVLISFFGDEWFGLLAWYYCWVFVYFNSLTFTFLHHIAYVIEILPTPMAANMPAITLATMAPVFELLSWHLPFTSYLPLMHYLHILVF